MPCQEGIWAILKAVVRLPSRGNVLGLGICSVENTPTLGCSDRISAEYGVSYYSPLKADPFEKEIRALGSAPVDDAEPALFVFQECGKVSLGDTIQHDATDAEKELLPSLVISYGFDSVRHDVRIFIGLDQSPITAAIQELTAGTTKLKRYFAARALAQWCKVAKPAVDTLCQALHDDGRNVRRMAAVALGRIGVATGAVIDALRNASRDADSAVQLAANESLRKLGSAER